MSRFKSIFVIATAAGLLIVSSGAAAENMRVERSPGLGGYDLPFFANGAYRDDVQSPSEFLGFELGSWPSSHADMIRYFTYLGESFPNVSLHDYATSYEGRRLVYLVITSEDRAGGVEQVKAYNATLADPRGAETDDIEALIESHPATAWLAYGIHGDELSSSDAALQLAYQIVAGTDETTQRIRDNVVVCIDALQNPDGRERWLKQLEINSGAVPNTDIQSLHHQGRCPWGRGNHYLFDLNRDWFVTVHPESRGKVAAIHEWHPHFLLDCHEMGPLDTYLFSPPRAPFNPYRTAHIQKWWGILAAGHAETFDRYGWSYYTREWNEEFFPGYGSSWGMYTGAVGMLYEQAGVDGSQVKRRDGTTMSYRETVHHQFVSSMSDLGIVAERRKELLEDYTQSKLWATGMERGSKTSAAFIFAATANSGRLLQLAETLERQKIEIEIATEAFKVGRARPSVGEPARNLELPEGSLIVRVSQPLRHLVETILAFDIPLPTEVLESERRKRLKSNKSDLYGVTAWSVSLAFNLECYYTESLGKVETERYTPVRAPGTLIGRDPRYGYAVDGADDRSLVALARLFERDYKVWAAKKEFRVGDKVLDRGSLVLRSNANPGLDERNLEAIARETGVNFLGIDKALGGELSDLGGANFVLLEPPRIAIVGGPPASTYQFGSVWHLLDSRLGVRVSTLNGMRVPKMDLRKYNVIVLPAASTWTGVSYKNLLGDGGVENLRSWVEAGGTLIAMGGAAAFLADSSVAVSNVRQRRQVLDELADYRAGSRWIDNAATTKIDSAAFWGRKAPEQPDDSAVDLAGDDATAELDDKLARRLSPRGAIMAVDLDESHWLTYGERSPLPLLVATSYAYMGEKDSQPPGSGLQVPGRFAKADGVRLSGLLWPEARERWGGTIGVSREPLGKGQIILFASQPNFRAYFYGGQRLLLNSILLGPGFGARPPVEW